MCFYDLQKAFDSIQYPVLLKRLYESGVERQSLEVITKLVYISKEYGESEWPAVLTTHSGAWSSPRIRPFPSPLPADNGPPPEILAEQGSRSVCGSTYMQEVSSMLMTYALSAALGATLQEQINTVCTFAANNGLTLNPTKCEVMLISSL